jgi:multiple sugar transport system substrate-binding protein
MTRQRRRLAIICVAVTAAVVLSACSSSGSKNDGPKHASGPVTLTLLEYQKIRADAVAALLPKFETDMAAAGQKIHVKLIRDILPDDQFRTKITQEYTGGNAPDVTDYGATYIPGFAGAGYLLDLTPYLSKWPDWKAFYPQIVDQIKQPDGKIYSLPHEANTQNLFYRKDVLQKLGISTAQPTSWAELMQRLEDITAKTGQPAIVLPAGTSWGDGTLNEGFLNVMLGSGSPLYDTKTNKWIVKSPGLTKSFSIYADLVKNKLLPVQALLNPEPWQPTKYIAFPKGTLPVAAQGTWGWRYDWGPSGSAPIPNLFQIVDTWDYPSDSGEPYSVSSVGFEYEVTAKTKHPDAAVELAEWLSSASPMAAQLVAVGAAAPRSGIDNVAPYSTQPTLLSTEKQLATSLSFPSRPGQAQISQAVGEATEDILTGKADGPGAAASFAKNATDLLTSDQVESQGS